MTQMIQITIEGQAQLTAQLRRLGGSRLKSVAKAATRKAMRPVLAAARAEVPVDSGRLSASIASVATQSARGGFVGQRVGIRRDYNYTSTSGEKTTTHRGDKQAKALSKGFTKDTKSASQYAGGIIFGTDKSGRVRRSAGPRDFLNKPILSNESGIVSTMGRELQTAVEST